MKADLSKLCDTAKRHDPAIPEAPFIAHYKYGTYRLEFAAVTHASYRPDTDPAYQMIKAQFDTAPPAVLVVEGYDGSIPHHYLPTVDEDDKWRSEQDYAIYLARTNKPPVPVFAGDTPIAQLFDALVN